LSRKKSVEERALEVACRWLEEAGCCKKYPGYTCDKDFSQPGVCGKCLKAYFLKEIREEDRRAAG
jgi:hypothetical protein